MEHHHGHAHGVHGMLVLGGQRTETALRSPVYVSHLPMFSSPHNFQVILRVGWEAARTYGDFVAHFGLDPIFTFQPEPFSIDELDPSASGGPARTSFRGTLFRGHFERGGSKITSDVPFEVEQVIHFRRFQSRAGHHKGPLRYLCFGQRDAAHLAPSSTGRRRTSTRYSRLRPKGWMTSLTTSFGTGSSSLSPTEVTRSTRGCSRARLSRRSWKAGPRVDRPRSSSWLHPSTTSRPETSPRSEAPLDASRYGRRRCCRTADCEGQARRPRRGTSKPRQERSGR